MSDDEDFGEQFLQANANVDCMAHKLADCLRNCMRAVATNDPSSAAFNATQEFDLFLKLLVRSEGVRLGILFDKAIEAIRPVQPDFTSELSAYDEYAQSIMQAAQDGIRYLVENSCGDNAARGRTSQRKSDFLSAIKRNLLIHLTQLRSGAGMA